MKSIELNEREASIMRVAINFALEEFYSTSLYSMQRDMKNGKTEITEDDYPTCDLALKTHFKAKMMTVKSPLSFPYEIGNIIEIVNLSNRISREFNTLMAPLIRSVSESLLL